MKTTTSLFGNTPAMDAIRTPEQAEWFAFMVAEQERRIKHPPKPYTAKSVLRASGGEYSKSSAFYKERHASTV